MRIFRALRHRNFRLFFIGQTISLTGTWIQQVALQWLVFRMTHSALILGLVGFLGQIPNFLVAPFAGVYSDRLNRLRLLKVTQGAAMVQAGVLAVLVLSGTVTLPQIFILSILLGVITAFDVPARQSLYIEMIENKSDLSNAIALNSSMVNVARLIGPAVAGILIATMGEGICFLLNAASYVAVLISLFKIKIPYKKMPAPQEVLKGLREGFLYAFQFKPIRAILLLLGWVSLMGTPFMVLMPVFVHDYFHGGPSELGFMVGFSGLGALSGALYLAYRKGIKGLGRRIAWAAVFFGVTLVAFSFSRSYALSLALLFCVGFGMIVHLAASNTILQSIVEDDKRGRIMSFYAMAFMGMAPFGSLLAGTLAARIGAPGAVLLSGLSCIVAAGFFWTELPEIRKILKHTHPHLTEPLPE